MEKTEIKDDIKKYIRKVCKYTLKKVKKAVLLAEENNLTNEGFYINFEDSLNKYSVRDHSLIKKKANETDGNID